VRFQKELGELESEHFETQLKPKENSTGTEKNLEPYIVSSSSTKPNESHGNLDENYTTPSTRAASSIAKHQSSTIPIQQTHKKPRLNPTFHPASPPAIPHSHSNSHNSHSNPYHTNSVKNPHSVPSPVDWNQHVQYANPAQVQHLLPFYQTQPYAVATSGSISNPVYSTVPYVNGNEKGASQPHDEKDSVKEKKQKLPNDHVALRTVAGKKWVDESLTEWPENDFRLFVGNLSKDTTDSILAAAFQEYPSFNMARVVIDKASMKCKGFGFVSFGTPVDFLHALKHKNGKYVGNRPCTVKKSSWQQRAVKNQDPEKVNQLKAAAKHIDR